MRPKSDALVASTPEPQEPTEVEQELPPLPSWPPPSSEYPPGRNFKVIYDPAIEGSPSTSALIYAQNNSESGPPLPSFYRTLIDLIRKNGTSTQVQERIRGKGKGRELLYRMEGEVFEMAGEDGLREPEVLIRDPRKVDGFKRMPSLRPGRNEFYEVKYEVRATFVFFVG